MDIEEGMDIVEEMDRVEAMDIVNRNIQVGQHRGRNGHSGS